MDPLFEAYLAAQRRRRGSPLTIKAVTHALRTAQRWLDNEGVAAGELSLLGCEQYFDQLLDRQALSTVRRQLAYLRAAYRYAHRHGLCDHDPTAEVKLPRLPDLEPATYSNEQLKAIHAAIRSEREDVAFYLFAFAGLRLSELCALTWNDVDAAHWQLRLIGKGRKFRLVPLHPVLQELLRDQRRRALSNDDPVVASARRTPLAPRTLGETMRLLVSRAAIDVNNPCHAFRRTVATVMYEQGVRTRVIEKIMGWAPRQMHERHYLRVADETMRQAILTLYRDDPISDRHTASLQLRPLPHAEAPATGWLHAEHARLDGLEQRLDLAQ
jgi:integrase/recombinase XerC